MLVGPGTYDTNANLKFHFINISLPQNFVQNHYVSLNSRKDKLQISIF